MQLQTRTMQNNNLQAQINMLEQSMQLARQAQAHAQAQQLDADDGSGSYPFGGFYPSQLSSYDEIGSRPTTPEGDLPPAFGLPGGGIGTGFGGTTRLEHSGTPESNAGFAAPGAFPTDTNGTGHYSHQHPQHPSTAYDHQSSLAYNGLGSLAPSHLLHNGRLRSPSGLSTDYAGFFNPDDDELVPDKVKRRRSGFGAPGSIGSSARDGGASEGSGSSGGGNSPAVKYRGVGISGSPSPRG